MVSNQPCSKCTPSIGAISCRSTPTIRTSAAAVAGAVALGVGGVDDRLGVAVNVDEVAVGSIPGALSMNMHHHSTEELMHEYATWPSPHTYLGAPRNFRLSTYSLTINERRPVN